MLGKQCCFLGVFVVALSMCGCSGASPTAVEQTTYVTDHLKNDALHMHHAQSASGDYLTFIVRNDGIYQITEKPADRSQSVKVFCPEDLVMQNPRTLEQEPPGSLMLGRYRLGDGYSRSVLAAFGNFGVSSTTMARAGSTFHRSTP